MATQSKRIKSSTQPLSTTVQKNYSEVVEFLDKNWSKKRTQESPTTFQKLDKALSNPSHAFKSVIVSGTNGKSLALHFTTRLLQEEKQTVGSFCAPHILLYNERISVDSEHISNKIFTEIANEVLHAAALENLSIDSLDLLTMMAFLHFKKTGVALAAFELLEGVDFQPIESLKPTIVAITRLTADNIDSAEFYTNRIKALLNTVSVGTTVVSADQNKAHLRTMMEVTEAQGGTWAMPIRKLAALPYPFEQLHGRSAALAERIAQIFIDSIEINQSEAKTSLLAKQKGQRGRPTLEGKRQTQLNPKRTIEQFWKETTASIPARFQILDKEKPTILLDTAHNVDAFKNLFLGIRLLHYQKPLKGLTFILGCDKKSLDVDEFLKLLRYFSKKNSAQVIFCPIKNDQPGLSEESLSIETLTNEVKVLKIKAKACKNFAESFEAAKSTVDERNGLLVIAGSQSIITEYWRYKGMKKVS